MFPSSILLNARARVYNLRFLLVATILIILLALKDIRDIPLPYFSEYTEEPLPVMRLAGGIIIWVHHIFAVFPWTLHGLAVVDLAMVLIEIAGLVYLTSNTLADEDIDMQPIVSLLPSIAPLPFLFFSLLSRSMTVLKSKEKLLVQRFVFLGCCAKSNPPYTVASVLLNRSLARPLVRGESKYIIVARAVVLSATGVGVPAFGIYVTMVEPAAATVSTAWIQPPPLVPDLPGNVTIYLEANNSSYDSYPWNISVTVTTSDGGDENINCKGTSDGNVKCPCAWSDIQIISFSVVVPSGAGFLYVWIGCDSGQCVCDSGRCVDSLAPAAVLLLPGSQLFGSLAWSQRQTIPQSMETSSMVFSPEVHGLQQNTSAEGAITSLTLSVVQIPIRYFRDSVSTSTLSGIATFGGFWTFVNGTFALFFGANIVYFAFGRRPLSALGVVHLCQRRSLVRKWYEDFPAIQTEGGLPGSENAGIVAFIRERLVDLGDDTRDIEQRPRVSRVRAKIGRYSRTFPWKKKIQRFKSQSKNARASPQESNDVEPTYTPVSPTHEAPPLTSEPSEARSRRGYILDEIPLLDIDLSPEHGAQNIQDIPETFPPRI
ncbi:Short-chain dehydrogenase/reductase family protein [Mycena sanguinolenta]|uniref:Short-chain dehydrogenase/reductase family protein n=1 Tax=Mycena sanguinolenta TaxID=230812 RepID=A0A8H7CVG5_9AGAR|nr:Short-chain dehydrogenase/reductase family protein [Mycena sanguinolenta]